MIISKIKGVISPLIVPFKRNEDIDFDKYAANLEKWNEDRLSGFFVSSAAGEFPFLTEKEKLQLVETTVQVSDKNRLIIVGTGMESTKETVKMTNKVASLGADAALVMPPSFYLNPMTPDSYLIDYYAEIAEKTDIPILIYNAPQYTHIEIPIRIVHQLCNIPNIIGIKENSPDLSRLIGLKKQMPGHFNIIAGLASLWYPAVALGIEAGILGMANYIPNECAGILEAYEMGNCKEALEMFMRLFPVVSSIETMYGIPGLKYAASLAGYEGGEVRRPFQPLTAEEQEEIKTSLAAARLFLV